VEWSQFDPELIKISDNKGMTQVLERGQRNLKITKQVRDNRFKTGHAAGFIVTFEFFYASLVGSGGRARESHGMRVAASSIEFLSQIHATTTRCN
jgi:hypothetical protein